MPISHEGIEKQVFMLAGGKLHPVKSLLVILGILFELLSVLLFG